MTPKSTNDENQLLIRCPSCSQRFKVGHDLRDRVVECGGCEHRFKIGDDVIVRSQKFYPGEKRGEVEVFARVAPAADASRPEMGMDVGPYRKAPNMAMVEPTSPQRLLLAGLGVSMMVLMMVILIFGTGEAGLLSDVPMKKLMMISGFVSLVGSSFLLYGNPKSLAKAGGVSIVSTAVLMLLPVMTQHPKERKVQDGEQEYQVKQMEADAKKHQAEMEYKLKQEYGLEPLVDQIAADASMRNGTRACGIWLKGLRDSNRLLVRDYVQRVTGTKVQPHLYPRGNGHFLLVIAGTKLTLEEVTQSLHGVLGEVGKVYESLALFEMEMNNSVFDTPPVGQLADTSKAEFYELNLQELKSIEVKRIRDAVKRLKSVEPKLLRVDITQRLLDLLDQPWCDFKEDVCEALMVWSLDMTLPGEKVMAEVQRMESRGRVIEKSMIALAVKAQRKDILPHLMELWHAAPTDWEKSMVELRLGVEEEVIRAFPDTEGALKQSAIRILGDVGGELSVKKLREVAPMSGAETRFLIDKALEKIGSR